jgi:hypothetical protein
LRHYVVSWKLADSIPGEVIDFLFNLPNPSSCTMALGLTQLLTEMSTNILLGAVGIKFGWHIRLRTSQP